jgi:hypothetical protein
MTRSNEPLRIAMWSGPRNISTAMMRSWGNRPDTVVCDEPLYAHYLETTGLGHPGARDVIDNGETDWRAVVAWLTGPIPGGKTIFYQKHMAHHLLPGIDRSWLDRVTHAFLIRDPRDVLTSLMEFLPDPTLEDTGLPRQVEIFERAERETGRIPPVIDSRDVLQDPEGQLRLLCRALDVSFRMEMLSWPAGARDTDGVWAKHWYASVEGSTTFRPWAPKTVPLPPRLRDLHVECVRYYERLHRHRLQSE